MRSVKLVKKLEDILLPYKVVFPVTVEGMVNNTPFKFEANKESEIKEYSVFEALMHSSYAKYIGG